MRPEKALFKLKDMDKDTLATIKEKLEEKKARLEKELAQFSKESNKLKGDYDAEYPDMGNKDDENALEVAAYSDRLTLERTLEKSLGDVNKALDKVEKGDYGICKYCNKPINEKDLFAFVI